MAVDLSKEIADALKAYTTDVEIALEEAQADISKHAVSLLKSSAPKKSGKYARSWKVTKTGKGLTIHNGKHYRLTHLLEYGHAKRNGGRTRAYTHIAPVANMVVKEFEEQVKRNLS